ncbi:hypothetical protein GHK33_20575 [Sinorhizobium meliloti]|uniref:Uncharacterized protein n=1 Tax=Rhizobium meliloti TaxID=382 RepID=A0A6A7ZXG3_RHIML|nr:hypothetical protein [Sinorhizobium meliloti]MDW9376820.1 hypothetical protein [Sinorhizobium meliloti]MDW9495368.1 hypothetical protein [Sinorhizobium meliloti]MDW9563723.1 hypothetical protein [Sinorhizobium meliloti]MDW9651143.1 hypothetical protein [Sinorhizobium meliloti]MDW9861607.1 hypothetical protein [Sinorhizobium meliloti]
MTENSKIPPAKKTIEDPPEYSTATAEAGNAAHSISLDKMPPWSIPSAENVAGGSVNTQGSWNSGHPGGVAVEGPSEAAPSGSDAVSKANSPPASEATMRYNPRYSAKDQAQEDPAVPGDPINQADQTRPSSETSDDYSPFGTGSGQ